MVYLDMVTGIEEEFNRIGEILQAAGETVKGKSDGKDWTTLEVRGLTTLFPIAGYYKQEELKFFQLALSNILKKKGIDFSKVEKLESQNPDQLSKRDLIKGVCSKALEEPMSRRGVITSPDGGCISMIQILYRSNSTEVFVYFRSSNLYILLYDLLMLYRGLYASKAFRNRLRATYGRGEVNCIFGSAHLYLQGGPDFRF